MATIVARAPTGERSDVPIAPTGGTQVGAVSFSDLVRAHYRREEERASGGTASPETVAEYEEKLARFEASEGKIAAVYWSMCKASAVALTIGVAKARHNPFADTEIKVRLHRVTDWATADTEAIAGLLHQCDLLAIRVGEILRGTSERIAMRWIYAVEQHVLGYIERTAEPDPKQEREVVAAQRRELARIEDYYLRAAAKSGRIVYASGMLVAAVAISGVCATIAAVLATETHYWTRDVQVLLLCTGAGAVGALVSVLSRMSGGEDKFTVDFEVGRPLLRRLGLYKPLVGSVFGVALYFLLASGLLMTEPPKGKVMYFYGIVAFFAGFSERFTGVMFGSAQRLVTGEDEQPETPPPDKAAAGKTA